VRTERLTDAERALLPGLMVRLVRLGDTGGAIRRQARLDDLDPGRRALAQKLAAPEQHRLLMTTESAVEVSHEALFAQWPWLQTLLKSHSEEIRTLGRLGEQTALWEASRHAFSALPNAADRASYQALAKARPDWLARPERALLSRANVKRFLGFFGLGTALAAIMAFGVAAVFFWTAAREAEQRAAENNARAQAALGEARDNAATAFAALARVEAARGNDVGAAALALAAWPRDAASRRVRLPQALGVLSDVLPALVAKRAFGAVSAAPDDLSAKLSPDGRHVLLADAGANAQLRLYDTVSRSIVDTENLFMTTFPPVVTPDGKYAVLLEDGANAQLKLYDIAARTIVDTENLFNTYQPAVLSPDGQFALLVDTSGTAQLKVYSLSSFSVVATENLFDSFQAPVVTPNSQFAVLVDTGSNAQLKLFSLQSFSIVDTENLFMKTLSPALTADSRSVMLVEDDNNAVLKIYDIPSQSISDTENLFGSYLKPALSANGEKALLVEDDTNAVLKVYDFSGGNISDTENLFGSYFAPVVTADSRFAYLLEDAGSASLKVYDVLAGNIADTEFLFAGFHAPEAGPGVIGLTVPPTLGATVSWNVDLPNESGNSLFETISLGTTPGVVIGGDGRVVPFDPSPPPSTVRDKAARP